MNATPKPLRTLRTAAGLPRPIVFAPIAFSVCLLCVACGSKDAGNGNTGVQVGTAPTNTDTNAAADTSDTGSSSASQQDATSSDIANAAPDVTPLANATVLAIPSSTVVKLEKFGGTLEVDCLLLVNGAPVTAPVDWQIVADNGAIAKGGVWAFTKPGPIVVTCKSPSNGVSGAAEVLVASKFLHPSLARLSAEIGGVAQVLTTVTTAPNSSKAPLLKSLLTALERHAVRAKGAFGHSATIFMTAKPLPSLDALEKAGLVGGADDVAWLTAVGEAIGTAKALETALGDVDPTKIGAADVELLNKQNAQLVETAAKLTAVTPSEWQVRKSTLEINALVSSLAATASAHSLLIHKALAHAAANPPPPPCPTCFNLAEPLVSVAVTGILGTQSYQSFLRDVGWTTTKLYTQMTLKKTLDAAYVPASNAPIIEQLANNALNQIHQGDTVKVWGKHFDKEPGACDVMFVSPKVSGDALDIVKKGIELAKLPDGWTDDDIFAAAQFVQESWSYIDTFVVEMMALHNWQEGWLTSMPTGVVQDILTDGAKQMVTLAKVPEGIVCGKAPEIALLYPFCGVRVGKSAAIDILGADCP